MNNIRLIAETLLIDTLCECSYHLQRVFLFEENIMKREKIFNLTNGKCFYCGCKLDIYNFHIDHFEPQSKGGKTNKNLVPSCPSCNLCKSDLSIEDFRHKLENLVYTREGLMINKYHKLKPQEVIFYFEKENIYGNL